MKHHIDKAKAALGDLGGLANRTEAAERNILAAAEKRLDEVNRSIERSHTGIEIAPEKEQDNYVALVEERAQLNIVIAKAKVALGIK